MDFHIFLLHIWHTQNIFYLSPLIEFPHFKSSTMWFMSRENFFLCNNKIVYFAIMSRFLWSACRDYFAVYLNGQSNLIFHTYEYNVFWDVYVHIIVHLNFFLSKGLSVPQDIFYTVHLFYCVVTRITFHNNFCVCRLYLYIHPCHLILWIVSTSIFPTEWAETARNFNVVQPIQAFHPGKVLGP